MTIGRTFSVYGLLCALGAGLVAACDPRFVHGSDLRPAEIHALAGTWEGRASLSYSSATDCTRVYGWRMQVADGNVTAEIIDPNRPNATPARFTSFVEYDGSVHAEVSVFGRDTAVLGTFNRDGFEGNTRARGCNYAVRLRQRPGGS